MAEDEPLDDYDRVQRQALNLLARREHSAYELRLKLWRREFDDALIEAAIKALLDDNRLSDARFAETYAEARARRGFGPVRIRGELQQRGVADSLAEDALDRVDADWEASAAEQRVRRFGGAPPETERERQRQYRYLTQRGFTSDQARAALRDDT